MDDDQKKRLEAAVRVCDRVAKEHQSHPCDTTPIMRALGDAVRTTLAASRGPAQVATDAYRANWETLFGGKRDRSVN